jgi:hypothetical protein
VFFCLAPALSQDEIATTIFAISSPLEGESASFFLGYLLVRANRVACAFLSIKEPTLV